MRAARGALAKVRARRRVVGVIRWRDMVTAVMCECVRRRRMTVRWLIGTGCCRAGLVGLPMARGGGPGRAPALFRLTRSTRGAGAGVGVGVGRTPALHARGNIALPSAFPLHGPRRQTRREHLEREQTSGISGNIDEMAEMVASAASVDRLKSPVTLPCGRVVPNRLAKVSLRAAVASRLARF
jgi:hypothetical protein